MSYVLIIKSSYADCARVVERAFAEFPLDVKGKKVVVKVNALRACRCRTTDYLTQSLLTLLRGYP